MLNMKTLVEKNTNVSVHLWHDSYNISIDETGYTINGEEIRNDFNVNTADVLSVAEVPDDWMGCRYLYVNNEWHANPAWVNPNQE